jgi:hypothetical protein
LFTLAVFLLSFFSGVVVSVTPRQEFLDVDSVLRASLNSSRDIPLEFITFEDTVLREGVLKNLKDVSEKAKGQVVIFNAFSQEPQSLVQGTRLEAPNGNIYRISKQVTIPGAKVENGKLVPQGIEVTVVADKPGEAYNLGLSDFTIPGFKGTERFDKFYGRSKTEITGGFVGQVPVVSQEDVDGLVKGVEETFLNTLRQRISRDLPKGVFVPEGGYEVLTTVEKIEPPLNSPGEVVSIRVKGVLRALAMKEDDIAKFLGRAYFSLGADEEVEILNLKNLSFEIMAKNFEDKTMTFKIRGRAHFVWKFDAEALKSGLHSASRAGRKDVFKKYSAIERAEIKFKPSWWRIFPSEASAINIERVLVSQ